MQLLLQVLWKINIVIYNACFCRLLNSFNINNFQKKKFWNTIRVSNSLDQYQSQHFAWLDLGSGYWQVTLSGKKTPKTWIGLKISFTLSVLAVTFVFCWLPLQTVCTQIRTAERIFRKIYFEKSQQKTRVTWKITQLSKSYINFASLWWINAIHFQIYYVAFKFCWSVHSWIVIYIVNMQNRCSYYDKNLRLKGICLLLHWWNDGIHARYLACSRKQYTVNL